MKLKEKFIISYLVIFSSISIFCGYLFVRTPSAPENSILFGLSLKRLSVLSLLLCLFLASLIILISKIRRHYLLSILSRIIKRKNLILFIFSMLIVSFSIAWYFYFLPIGIMGKYEDLYVRFKPILLWVLIVSFQSFLFLVIFLHNFNFKAVKQEINHHKKKYLFSLLSLSFFLIIWLVISITLLGISKDLHWDSVGVPLTLLQVLISIFICTLIFHYWSDISKKVKGIKHINNIDFYIFIVLWIIAAILWISAPQQTSTFNPGPFPPNNQYYPNSDAETYDACAQSVLIGQPFCHFYNNVPKPLYSFVLLLLHIIAGQNNSAVINLQVLIFGVMPPLLYLLGKSLKNRFTGLLIAILAILKVRNSIVSNLTIWKVSNPKMMMSEFPLAIMLILFTYCLVKWSKDTQVNRIYVLLGGSVLGFSILIRHNVWALLPLLIIFFIITARGNVKKKAINATLVLTFFFTAILPWTVRNYARGEVPITAYKSLKYVVWENRFSEGILDSNAADQSSHNTESDKSPHTHVDESSISPNHDIDISSGYFEEILNITSIVSNHYLHNLVSMVFTLPISPISGGISNIVPNIQPESPWNFSWNGQINISTALFITMNLIIISIGLGSVYYHFGKGGLVPLFVMAIYNLGVAVARTSGGRYIVPMDWVILLYYAAGINEIIVLLKHAFGQSQIRQNVPAKKESINKFFQRKRLVPALLLGIFIVASLFPISELAFPKAHFIESADALFNRIENEGHLTASEIKTYKKVISDFLKGENAILISGKVLYPRLLRAEDDNTKEFFSEYLIGEESLYFKVMNETGKHDVYLKTKGKLTQFPNGKEVIVIGCLEKGGAIKAKSIFIFGKNIIIPYVSQDWPSIDC
mgnify:CR=1 FL=1